MQEMPCCATECNLQSGADKCLLEHVQAYSINEHIARCTTDTAGATEHSCHSHLPSVV
jgi:hypothetical protein